MKWFVAALAAVAIVVPTKAFSCDEHEGQASAKKPAIQSLTVKQLADAKQAGKATVYDANTPDVRQQMGIIPGAKLLVSAVKYEPSKELPADKSGQVVFYCYNEQCGASHMAAKRASEAGYTNVAVLPAGIKGWKDAGQPTATPGQS
ncbi:MAG TPA: rhodanese-like domain-containing protein [Myxococcaceae bacterium]|nr:rhodanese-like domain-containing protein [Myxococcaceae bacterium]